MKVITTSIPDVLIFEPIVHGDERGYFMETFRESLLSERGLSVNFVQDNQSKSTQGTLRGLHYQLNHPQGKLARIVSGEVFDVAVDMRRSSKYFGQWVGVTLSAENNRQLWIPPGFAHGFYVLSESAELLYKCSDYYHPEDENSLLWNDETVAIDWPLLAAAPIMSEKDRDGKKLTDAPYYSCPGT